MSDHIGIDNMSPELGEDLGGVAFSRSNIAG
jgi:hypothetical protein